MNAIRTVSETPDVHVIEGLGYPFAGPFRGKDSYGTRFSARTNFYWDLFPDSEAEPTYVRPTNYQHGFDPEMGLSRVGGWSPVRTDDKGVWVQIQLDKHHAYYSAIRELLDADALALSGESAEHSVRIARDGEVIDWPAYALGLTPTPSNPMAVIATRTAETAAAMVRPAARAYSEAASDAAMGAGAMGTLLYVLSCEADEPEQVAMIQRSIDALAEWLAAERAEVGTPEDLAESNAEAPYAYYSAMRAGKRNSASDQGHVDAIHDHAAALGATAHTDDSSDASEAAARSGDALPTLRIVERPDPEAVRHAQLADADRIGREVAARLTG